MKFVPAKCTQCGAELKVDKSKEAAICEHCGTPFIVEKAISNYSTYISANSISIEGQDTAANLAESAQKFIDSNDFMSAEDFVKRLEEKYISDYRTYYYRILIITHSYDVHYYYNKYGTMFDVIDSLYNKAKTLAPENCAIDIEKEYINFVNLVNEIKHKKEEEENQKKLEAEEERKRFEALQKAEASKQAEIQKQERAKRLAYWKKNYKKYLVATFAIILFFIIIYNIFEVQIQTFIVNYYINNNKYENAVEKAEKIDKETYYEAMYQWGLHLETIDLTLAKEKYEEINKQYSKANERLEIVEPYSEYAGKYYEEGNMVVVNITMKFLSGEPYYDVEVLKDSICGLEGATAKNKKFNETSKLSTSKSDDSYANLSIKDNKTVSMCYTVDLGQWGVDTTYKPILSQK